MYLYAASRAILLVFAALWAKEVALRLPSDVAELRDRSEELSTKAVIVTVWLISLALVAVAFGVVLDVVTAFS